mmetsp:Transcript_79280/g.123680  ORF Transcript_79280/g.123680 Transcript_79280/m.123680 type:complete len:258 (-) Transcript_79280:77-850(-)
MTAKLSGPYAAMAGVAGKILLSPPVAEPPTITERSCANSVKASSRQGRFDELRSATQQTQQTKRFRYSDRVEWGAEHRLVKDPKHLGHIMAPDPESAVRKLGKCMPSKSMKDLWRLRDRGSYPVRASSAEQSFNATSTPESALLAAAFDPKFSHFGNSWTPLSRSQSAGSVGFTRERTMRSPNASKGLLEREEHVRTSTSIGWRPGSQDSQWSSPCNFIDAQPWKHGLSESKGTKYVHNQIMSGMVNARPTRALQSR